MMFSLYDNIILFYHEELKKLILQLNVLCHLCRTEILMSKVKYDKALKKNKTKQKKKPTGYLGLI